MDENQSEELDLGTAPIGKMMRSYALPCIISLLVAALYNIVDQIFIGWGVGAEGNGATNIVYPLTVMALAVATMIGDGACSHVSICLGARDKENAHRTVGNAIVLAILAGLALMLIYLIFRGPLLRLFGATDNVSVLTKTYANRYFSWIALGVPFYVFGQAMNPIIRSDGSPKIAMAATLAGAAANIVLDPFAIFVLKWDVRGAAIATVAGQVLTALISVLYLLRMKQIHLSRTSFGLWGKLMKKFIPLGFTSFLSQFSIVLSMAAMNNMVAKYGALSAFGEGGTSDTPMAVLGIVMKFYQIMISVVIGMAAGCIPVVGFNLGAGKTERCRELMRRLLTYEFIVGCVALLAFECFPRQLINLFGTGNSETYYRFAKLAFRIYLSAVPLDCICKASFIFLQSLGKPVQSTLLSFLREVVLSIPLALILPWLVSLIAGEQNGIYGLLASMPAAVVTAFLVAVGVDFHTYRSLAGSDK